MPDFIRLGDVLQNAVIHVTVRIGKEEDFFQNIFLGAVSRFPLQSFCS